MSTLENEPTSALDLDHPVPADELPSEPGGPTSAHQLEERGQRTPMSRLSLGSENPWVGRAVFLAVYAAFAVFLFIGPSTYIGDASRINQWAQYLCFAMVAVGLDIAWGYGGMLSLGQGLFFGLGAYCSGFYLTLENRPEGTELPSFMALYGNYKELPLLWRPFQHAWFAIAAAVVVPVIIAGLLGLLVFKRRIRGPYFALLTQATVVVFVLTIRGNLPLTAGVNGLTDFEELYGHHNYKTRQANYILGTNKFFYYVAAAALLAVILLALQLVNSRFGKVLQASKESEDRVRFLGYDPALVKTVAFMVAAGCAGLAGAIFAPVIGIVQPNRFDVIPSILMVCWVAVGGRGRIWGAVLGALLVNYLATHVSEASPDDWQYYQGLLFVVVLAYIPAGLIGLPRALYERARNLPGWRRSTTVTAKVDSLEVTG